MLLRVRGQLENSWTIKSSPPKNKFSECLCSCLQVAGFVPGGARRLHNAGTAPSCHEDRGRDAGTLITGQRNAAYTEEGIGKTHPTIFMQRCPK